MPIDKPIEEQNTQMSGEQYQQMLGTESYKQLLQADLQAENAKNVALRNTNMALQNAGLQGNAYGGTLASSTSNAYLTALQQNMSDFGNNIGQESMNNMALIQENLSQATTKDDYISYLNDMNIGVKADGSGLDWSKYEGYLNDTQKNLLNNEYMRQMEKFDNPTGEQDDGFKNFGTVADGSNVQTKFNKSNNNSDIDIKIGDEQYSVRLGNKGYRLEIPDDNGHIMSASAIKDKFANQKTGVPFVYEYTRNGDKCATILIKDENGDVRRLETKTGGRQSMINLAKKLGVKTGTKLQVRNYADANTWEKL